MTSCFMMYLIRSQCFVSAISGGARSVRISDTNKMESMRTLRDHYWYSKSSVKICFSEYLWLPVKKSILCGFIMPLEIYNEQWISLRCGLWASNDFIEEWARCLSCTLKKYTIQLREFSLIKKRKPRTSRSNLGRQTAKSKYILSQNI